jgi:SAM-dependent methyltransferase
MSINKELHKDLPPFVDPELGEPLDLIVAEKKYPVIDGIPRLLIERENYAAAFGEQWLRWRTTQLDSFSGTTITRDRLNRCLGDKGREMLSRDSNPTQVLEVGCGAGRFTEILLEFSSARVTSLDLSTAVEANQANFPQDGRHRIVQADIMHAPFKPEQFDLVICLGVIQHTPNPEVTIEKLFHQVRPGGMLIIDHYRPEIKRLTKITANLIRPIIKRFPKKYRMQTVELLVNIFFPVHRAIRNIPLAQQIFSRLSPINTYYHAYPQLPDTLQKEWSILDTHDVLTDWYKHLRTPKQISEVLERIGGTSIRIEIAGNGVEASCFK